MALPPTIASNTIVSNISGQTAAPAANTLTQLLDAILGAQPGAIIMRHGASWQALAAGSTRPGPAGSDLHGELGAAESDVRLRGCRGLCARQPSWSAVRTSWTTLPPGAAGSVLQTQGAHADPQWAQPASVPTGVVNPFIGDDRGVPPGWVLASGGTIGDASSGATARAHADTFSLWAAALIPLGPMHRRRSRVVAEPERRPISTPTRQSGFPTFAAGSRPARTTWAALRQAG